MDILEGHSIVYDTLLFFLKITFLFHPTTFSLNLPCSIDIFSVNSITKPIFLAVQWFFLHVPNPSLSFSSTNLYNILKAHQPSSKIYQAYLLPHKLYYLPPHCYLKLIPLWWIMHWDLILQSVDPQMAQPVSLSKMLFLISFPIPMVLNTQKYLKKKNSRQVNQKIKCWYLAILSFLQVKLLCP